MDIFSVPPALSASQGPEPDLDGTEGDSKYILFGTNVDLSDGEGD